MKRLCTLALIASLVSITGCGDDDNSSKKNNLSPVAKAGEDITVQLGAAAKLDGSQSYDPDKDEITYRWEVVSGPEGAKYALSDIKNVKPSFTTDTAGVYGIELTVNDGQLDSDPDKVLVVFSGDSDSEKPDTDNPNCAEDEHDESGKCVANQRTVDCTNSAPNKASLKDNGKIDQTWNSQTKSYEPAADSCEWECNTDYDLNETKDGCINFKKVDCVDNAPANASSVKKEVVIHYTTEGGWEDVPECEWVCNDGSVSNGSECIARPTIVISEFSPKFNLRGDHKSVKYVKLYNAGETEINMNGFFLAVKPEGIENWHTGEYFPEKIRKIADLSGIKMAGKSYLLIAETDFESEYGVKPDLVVPSIHIGSSLGNIYLLGGETLIGEWKCPDNSDTSVIDLVSYTDHTPVDDNDTCAEGTEVVLTDTSEPYALRRKNNADTDDNSVDFEQITEGFDPSNAAGAVLSYATEIDVVNGELSYASGSVFTMTKVETGTEGDPVIFKVKNTGLSKLDISGIDIDDKVNFALTATAEGIEPGKEITVSIVFKPTTDGNHTATLTITNNDSDEASYTVILKGEASTCANGEHMEEGVCVSDNRVADCTNQAPANASLNNNGKIDQTWNDDTKSYGPATDTCDWSCNTDYDFNELKTGCINTKVVDCADNAPENATSTVEKVTVNYTTAAGWTTPADCEWACNQGATQDGDQCLTEPHIVISEFSGKFNLTNNQGYTKYLKLYNQTANEISLDGYSIATKEQGQDWGDYGYVINKIEEIAKLDGKKISSKGYFLIAEKDFESVYGVTPDLVVDSFKVYTTMGTIFLRNGDSTNGSKVCPSADDSSIVDSLGYAFDTPVDDTDVCPEGSYVKVDDIVESFALRRVNNKDTGDNSKDFILIRDGFDPTNSSGDSLSNKPEIELNVSDTTYENASTFTFNKTLTGSEDSEATFKIKNKGLVNLEVTSIELSDTTNFEVTATPGSVEPGKELAFTVLFKPQTDGTHTATLTIANSDSDEGSYTVTLTGESISCAADEHFENGACAANERITDCTNTPPTNATLKNEGKIAQTWNSEKAAYEPSSDSCEWLCNLDYDLNDSNSGCINHKQVDCIDNAPENATSVDAKVTINFTTAGGWATATDCAWNCNQGMIKEGDQCIKEPGLVISEFSPKFNIKGGYASVKYIKIYNPTNDEINLDGYSIATKEEGMANPDNYWEYWSEPIRQVADLTGKTIASKGYLLVAEKDFASEFGVTPDITVTSLGIPSDQGNIFLRSGDSTNGSKSCPASSDDSIVDAIAYSNDTPDDSSDSCPETARFHLDDIYNPYALRRIDNNDSGDNSKDFEKIESGFAPVNSTGDTLSYTPEVDLAADGTSYASGSTFTFAKTATGTEGDTATFKIKNSGLGALNVTSIEVDDTTNFELTATPGSVEPGKELSFTVLFKPQTDATHTATLTIANSDSDEGTYTVTLTGESITCSAGEHFENGACAADQKTVDCTNAAPANATLNDEGKITQTWNSTSGAYEPAADSCQWTCNTDYDLNDVKDGCINQKQVDCTNNAPENAESTVTKVTINYTTAGGWETAADCAWTCKNGYKLENDACVVDPNNPVEEAPNVVISEVSPVFNFEAFIDQDDLWNLNGMNDSENNCFIEIHNAGTEAADMSNYVVAVRGGFEQSSIDKKFDLSDVIIPAGGYYLLAESGFEGNYNLTPDKSADTKLDPNGSTVFILKKDSALIGNNACPTVNNTDILDMLGYQKETPTVPMNVCKEGSVFVVTSQLSNMASLDGYTVRRKSDTDTNDNSVDFEEKSSGYDPTNSSGQSYTK